MINGQYRPSSYCTSEIQLQAEKSLNFHELSKVGLNLIETLKGDVILVCGPVSTGGLGSATENLNLLSRTVQSFIEKGEVVFDQTPFESVIKRLREELKDVDGTMTLEEFYRPIIESGYVKEMRFLKGWESSIGAKWEHDLAKNLSIKITYL